MGECQSDIHCPRCNYKRCLATEWYKSREWCIHCPQCGYYKSSFLKEDQAGNYIKIDETKPEEPNNLVYEEKFFEAYGTFLIENINGGSLFRPIAKKEVFDDFIIEVLGVTKEPGHNIKRIITKRFIDGQIIRDVIFKLPDVADWDEKSDYLESDLYEEDIPDRYNDYLDSLDEENWQEKSADYESFWERKETED